MKKKKLLKKNINALKVLSVLDRKSRKIFLKKAPKHLFTTLKTFSKAILDGSLQLNDEVLKSLRKYKSSIRSIAHEKDIKGLIQKGGSISSFFISVLPLIIPLLTSFL